MTFLRLLVIKLLLVGFGRAFGCTNLIITKGASKDGSIFMAYTNDAEYIYHLKKSPARDWPAGSTIELRGGDNNIGKIPQVPHTYATVGFHQNEHQVAIGETTFTGRMELWNKSKFLEYPDLMRLALERSKTAREALKVITDLVEEYGYASEGESFSITDKNEAWILEMVGTGNGGEGAIWVAVKIPDGMISAHANKARIGEFPLNDPENCLYSKNVISFAIQKGYYNPNSGKPFRFCDVYDPPTVEKLRWCESRVWSMFNRAAPSQKLSYGYCRGEIGAKPMPLWIKPDQKLGLSEVFALIRDHYEGTPWDMTQGFDAGPYNNPNRNRPLGWTVDSIAGSWERPISTFNTSFSFVAQSRNFLPDAIGGLIWFGEDDTYFTCYTPIYAAVTETPKPYAVGELTKFSWDCAWWVFNLAANYANLRYRDMVKDIQAVQTSLEQQFLAAQDSIEKVAVQTPPHLLSRILTDYCNRCADLVLKRWTTLTYDLIVKYNDGYVKDKQGHPQTNGYDSNYLRQTLNLRPAAKLPNWKSEDGRQTYTPY